MALNEGWCLRIDLALHNVKCVTLRTLGYRQTPSHEALRNPTFTMLLELVVEFATLVVLVLCGYAGLRAYLRLRRPQLVELFLRRRFAILGSAALLIVGIKVFEDVLGKESGVIDELVLRFVHTHVPPGLDAFFGAVTRSGSAVVLIPAAALVAIAFECNKHRSEAGLVMVSTGLASILVYVIKALTGRERPALWETQWYWGSSFPSGHTLSTAAFSTAVALCIARLWPSSSYWAAGVAMVWIFLVALSRLVLGVHWPSDVLAAMCLGMLLSLMMSMGFDLYRHRTLRGNCS